MAFNKISTHRTVKKETSNDSEHNANNIKQRNKGMGI